MGEQLLTAILSMDAYNRGYGAPINGLPGMGRIGSATILDIDLPLGSQAAGFSATAYRVDQSIGSIAAGTTVIAYRGTNSLFGSSTEGSDVNNGYGLGGGTWNAPQALLAADFYRRVNTSLGTTNPYNESIVTTGHSLGGGLAGFTASLYGRKSFVFDSMAFELGAQAGRLAALAFEETRQLLYGGNEISGVNSARVSKVAVEGEFLDGMIRATPYDTTSLLHSGSDLGPIDLHSASLLVNLIYARDYVSDTSWRLAGVPLWHAFFNPAVAAAIPQATARTSASVQGADPLKTLQNAIAYSAITDGPSDSKPFGDTGVRAMFDDATDLGRALSSRHATPQLSLYADRIAQTVVQYAGELALNDVEAAQQPSVTRGILGFDGKALTIDYSDATWFAASGNTFPPIVGKRELIDGILSDPGLADATRALMVKLWGQSTFAAFDRVALTVSVDGGVVRLPDAAVAGTRSLFTGSLGPDDLLGSAGRDLLLGGGGDDIFEGQGGDDILVADGGYDVLRGGDGNDAYIVRGASGTTLIEDDGGTLSLRGSIVGSDPSAPAGTTISGYATRRDATSWSLGDYTIRRLGSDLKVEQQGISVVLRNFEDGDYGITLAQSTGYVYQPNRLLVSHQSPHVYRFESEFIGGAIGFSYAEDEFNLNLVQGGLIVGTSFNDTINMSRQAIAYQTLTTIRTGAGDDAITALVDYKTVVNVDAGDGRDRIILGGGPGTVKAGPGDDFVRTGPYLAYPDSASPLTNIDLGEGADRMEGLGFVSLDGGGGYDIWDLKTDYEESTRGRVIDIDGVFDFNSGVLKLKNTYTYLDSTGQELYTHTNYPSFQFQNIEVISLPRGYERLGYATLGVYAKSDGNTLVGSAADNVIVGGVGNDRLYGGYGNDRLEGGPGNDELYGGAGDDWLSGGEGDDSFNFDDSGVSQIFGGPGRDTAYIPVTSSSQSLFASVIILPEQAGDTIVTSNAGTYHLHEIEVLGTNNTTYSMAIVQRVAYAYLTYGGRGTQASELHYWSHYFYNSATDIRTAILNDPLGIAHTSATVAALYQQYLGRSLSTGELTYWDGQVRAGTEFASVRAAIVADPAGQAHTAATVGSLYRTYLGRDAGAGELAFWGGQVRAGTDFNGVRSALVNDASGVAHTVATVNALYQEYGGRAASVGEIAFWNGQVRAGSDFATVRGAILDDALGQAHTATALMTLYREYFGRAPLAGEIATWTGLFKAGVTFDQTLDTLLSDGGSDATGVRRITGTAGADTIVLGGGDIGHSVIARFDPAADTIDLRNAGYAGLNLFDGSHLRQITALDGRSDVLVSFDAHHNILLQSLQLSSLTSADFLLS